MIQSITFSTRIEASKLSERAVGRLLSNIETKSLKSRGEQEVTNYAVVIQLTTRLWKEIDLPENHIGICVRVATRNCAIKACTKPDPTHNLNRCG